MTYMMLWPNTLFQRLQQHQALILSKLSLCKSIWCLSASQNGKFDCYLHVIFQDSHGLSRIDALPNFKALLTGTREGKWTKEERIPLSFCYFYFASIIWLVMWMRCIWMCAVEKRKNETTDPALPEEKEEERRGRYTPKKRRLVCMSRLFVYICY